MTVEKVLYENLSYDIPILEKSMDYKIPTLINTLYFDNMVIMPKCKTYIGVNNIDIQAVMNVIETTGYIALIRSHYKNTHLKRGCIARILNFIPEDEQEHTKIYVEGISRFLSYQDTQITGYPYDIIKPDLRLFEHDTIKTPIPIDFNDLDPIFIQFFLTFTSSLELENTIDFSILSLDKFLNSLIMMMPITDTERFYLSEIPSLNKRKEALSLILNSSFSTLTSGYKIH
jgi:Lon protease-like protein